MTYAAVPHPFVQSGCLFISKSGLKCGLSPTLNSLRSGHLNGCIFHYNFAWEWRSFTGAFLLSGAPGIHELSVCINAAPVTGCILEIHFRFFHSGRQNDLLRLCRPPSYFGHSENCYYKYIFALFYATLVSFRRKKKHAYKCLK